MSVFYVTVIVALVIARVHPVHVMMQTQCQVTSD